MRSWSHDAAGDRVSLQFLVGPARFALARPRISPIPALWALAAYCLVILLREPNFDRGRLWNTASLRQHALAILSLFAVMVALGAALVRRNAPGMLLGFPLSAPLVWGLVMVLYPLPSVYPHGIIYRLFLFDRYHGLFGARWGIVLASAAAFALVDIVFCNALAVAPTLSRRTALRGALLANRFADGLVVRACALRVRDLHDWAGPLLLSWRNAPWLRIITCVLEARTNRTPRLVCAVEWLCQRELQREWVFFKPMMAYSY
jgi:hypothetical protein